MRHVGIRRLSRSLDGRTRKPCTSRRISPVQPKSEDAAGVGLFSGLPRRACRAGSDGPLWPMIRTDVSQCPATPGHARVRTLKYTHGEQEMAYNSVEGCWFAPLQGPQSWRIAAFGTGWSRPTVQACFQMCTGHAMASFCATHVRIH